MAVVLGTSSGFVIVSPTVDPTGSAGTIDDYAQAQKDTAPIGANKITEIGWWCDSIHEEETNFEVGLYSHDAVNDKPGTRLYVDAVNAKGPGAGWRKVTVDWDITESTIYWLAVQVDGTTAATSNNWSSVSGGRFIQVSGQSTLQATWPAGSSTANVILGIYAVYTTTEYIDITGTIAETSSLSGTLIMSDVIDITGSITGVSTVGGLLGATLIISSNWQTINFHTPQRLVVAGSDSIWYEDI